jgi:hypothetical protein
MALPQTTQDRIENESEVFTNKYMNGKVNTHEFAIIQDGYIAGATAENSRAQPMADALEAFILWQGPTLENWLVMKQACEALQQWKDGKGKEVEPESFKESGNTFEYEIRHINNCYSEKKVINEMVGKGYRLIAVAPYCSGNSLYFERIKQQVDEVDRPCPHCGKELFRDRNLCCRECGEEVENEL